MATNSETSTHQTNSVSVPPVSILLLASSLPVCPGCLINDHLLPASNAINAAYNQDEIVFKSNKAHAAFVHLVAAVSSLVVHHSDHGESAMLEDFEPACTNH